MGYKRKIMHFVIIGCISVLVVVIIMQIYLTKKKDSDYYSNKLIEQINLQRQINVQNIFNFKFDRAYVFKDSYISGEGFAKAYNLNISINQVRNTDQEYIGRVVFVDEFGYFIFEFLYNKNDLILSKEGMIIYPDTVIQKCELIIEGRNCFEILSSDFY